MTKVRDADAGSRSGDLRMPPQQAEAGRQIAELDHRLESVLVCGTGGEHRVTAVLAGLVLVALSALALLVVRGARSRQFSPAILVGLAVLCAVALAWMLISDWPTETMSGFWRDHSIVSATASTLLLVGIGFLAFEAVEMQREETFNEQVTSAGTGGVVDHVIDVDVALSLVQRAVPPETVRWPGWNTPDHPLHWLRNNRALLARNTDGTPAAADPRSKLVPAALPGADPAWRGELVD